MTKRDLDQANNLYSALMRAIVVHPGGHSDPAAMREVSALCARTVETVNDAQARAILLEVESLARLLFSAQGHVDAEAGTLRGVAALKFQIYTALSNFRGRLQMLRSAPSKPELPALKATRDVRVLIVEDDHDSAQSLRKLLELCGYLVTVAYTSRDALEAAEKAPPDIVLCDIGLPDSDGYAFAAALRKKPGTASMRLIAVTAFGSEQDKKRSSEAGFQLHLVKPVKPEYLLEELAQPAKRASAK